MNSALRVSEAHPITPHQPRSYCFSGAARYDWQHSVPKGSQRRWSFTFRSLKQPSIAPIAPANLSGEKKRSIVGRVVTGTLQGYDSSYLAPTPILQNRPPCVSRLARGLWVGKRCRSTRTCSGRIGRRWRVTLHVDGPGIPIQCLENWGAELEIIILMLQYVCWSLLPWCIFHRNCIWLNL